MRACLLIWSVRTRIVSLATFNPSQPGRRQRMLLPVLMFCVSSDSAAWAACVASSIHKCLWVCATLLDIHSLKLSFYQPKLQREGTATAMGPGHRQLLGVRTDLATLQQQEGENPSQSPTLPGQVLSDIPHRGGLISNLLI